MESVKPLKVNDLTGEQQRQLIDVREVFESWREANREYRRRFAGSMRWGQRGSSSYLLRKTGSIERSLGPKSEKTEAIYSAFISGRKRLRERRAALQKRLGQMAPINRAMQLGRLPAIAGRIIRRCDEEGLIGEQIVVVGTNALFAYEAEAGVRLSSDVVATNDMDFLFDARRRLSLAVPHLRSQGLIGLLQKIDKTFTPQKKGSYRAANDAGYLVELIRPEAKDPNRDRLPATLGDAPDDLVSAPIVGLDWLLYAPKMNVTVIDTSGLPARMTVVDPRVFALHKLWLSERKNREAVKRRRDKLQALASAEIATRYLSLEFKDSSLNALPASLREKSALLLENLSGDNSENDTAAVW